MISNTAYGAVYTVPEINIPDGNGDMAVSITGGTNSLVPHIIDSYRAGNVAIVNAPGNGIADDKGVYYFVPQTTIVEYCYANNKNNYYNFEMCDVVSLRGRNAMLDDKPMIASTVKFITTPLTLGRRPNQRLRPALPERSKA